MSADATQMKAVKKFKSLIDKKRPIAMSGALGEGIRTLHHPLSMDDQTEPPLLKSRSVDLHDRRNVEAALASEGVHHDVKYSDVGCSGPTMSRMDSSMTMVNVPRGSSDDQPAAHHKPQRIRSDDYPGTGHPRLVRRESSGDKGHAHDPLDEEPLFLGIGLGGEDSQEPPPQVVIAESPTAAEFSIYDTAYQMEVERIRKAQGHRATIYLTRRVDDKKEYKADENMIEAPKASEIEGLPHQGFKGLLDRAREKAETQDHSAPTNRMTASSLKISDLAAKAMENTMTVGKDLSDKSTALLGTVLQASMEKRKGSEGKDPKES